MKRFVATAMVAAALCAGARAQTDAPAAAAYRLAVSYDRPGLGVPHWQITIPPRGMATYTATPAKGEPVGPVPFRLSDAGHARLGLLLTKSKALKPCETKSKGIANMGTKVVDYTADGVEAHCTFNYTDNKPLSEALDYMLAIAGTVQSGAELERLHRYDRLGLDPVMTRLAEDAKDGHAAELGAIRPVLESLSTDVAVMERVRTRAQQLLELAKQQETAAP